MYITMPKNKRKTKITWDRKLILLQHIHIITTGNWQKVRDSIIAGLDLIWHDSSFVNGLNLKQLGCIYTCMDNNKWLNMSFFFNSFFLQEWEKKNSDFATFKKAQEMRAECKGLNLGALLITPVQRVPR